MRCSTINICCHFFSESFCTPAARHWTKVLLCYNSSYSFCFPVKVPSCNSEHMGDKNQLTLFIFLPLSSNEPSNMHSSCAWLTAILFNFFGYYTFACFSWYKATWFLEYETFVTMLTCTRCTEAISKIPWWGASSDCSWLSSLAWLYVLVYLQALFEFVDSCPS